MDVPSTAAGVVKSVAVKKGDRVSKGSVIAAAGGGERRSAAQRRPQPARRQPTGARSPRGSAAAEAGEQRAAATAACQRSRRQPPSATSAPTANREPPAASSPSTKRASRARTPVRPCASSRASSAWISARVKGTGLKGRITPDDVKAWVKQALEQRRAGGRRRRVAEDSGSRFREVRPDRGQAARPHPEDLRSAAAGELAQCSARLADGRGGHHRARRRAQQAQGQGGEGGRQAHAARVHSACVREGAAASSRSSTARSMRRARTSC